MAKLLDHKALTNFVRYDNVVIIFLAILLPEVQLCYLYVSQKFLHMLKLKSIPNVVPVIILDDV